MTDESKPKVVEPWMREVAAQVVARYPSERYPFSRAPEHELPLIAEIIASAFARSRPAVAAGHRRWCPLAEPCICAAPAPPSSDPAPAPGRSLWLIEGPSPTVADPDAITPLGVLLTQREAEREKENHAYWHLPVRIVEYVTAPAPRETARAVAPDTGVPIAFLKEHGFVVPPEDVAGLLREVADRIERDASAQHHSAGAKHGGVAFKNCRGMLICAEAHTLIARLRAAAQGGA